MDDEVHDDEPPGGGGVLTEGVPAVDEDRDVVVPVEEYQLLLPQHDEDRVPQLGDLGEDEHPGPEAADPVLLYEAGDAEGVVEAVSVESVHELRQCPGRPHDAEHGEEHAPARQGTSQVERRPAEDTSLCGKGRELFSIESEWKVCFRKFFPLSLCDLTTETIFFEFSTLRDRETPGNVGSAVSECYVTVWLV